MKYKLLSVILFSAILITLSACGKDKGTVNVSDGDLSVANKASDWKPDVPQREMLSSEDCLCGVYYMDYSFEEFSGKKKNRKYYDSIFKTTGSIKQFPFLKDIPDENIVSTPMGSEVYLIIPADTESQVEVYLVEFDEELFTTIRSEEPLFSAGNGNPFVLQCNYGDLFSDAQIVITDSNGDELIWSPSISLRDGRVNTRTDDGKKIYDFTEYSEYNAEIMDD